MTSLGKFIFKAVKGIWALLMFIKNVIFSFLALGIMLFLLVLIFIYSPNRHSVPQDGALLIDLTGIVVDEVSNQNPLQKFIEEALNLSSREQQKNSLFDLVKLIRQASDDANITGIILSLDNFTGASQPSLEYIGKALTEFKQKKPIIAVGRNYSQAQYYLASFANEIYLTSSGSVSLEGIAMNTLYFHSLLDKLKITPHIFRVGNYKSAVEPYIRDNMSNDARENAEQWLHGLWHNYMQTVAANRNSDETQLNPDIDLFLQRLTELNGDQTAYAEKYHLVDKVLSSFGIESLLIKKFGSRDNSYKAVSIYDYKAKSMLSVSSTKASENGPTDDKTSDNPLVNNKIAVIFVNGTIANGENNDNIAGATTIVSQLMDARNRPEIKAIILRVNSPGGGVDASESIRSAIEAVRKQGKPVVVSMGSLAASGGYWISTAANHIIASPSTITGSIGIFGLFLTAEEGLDTIGVHADGVATSPLAATNFATRLDDRVGQLLQLTVDNGYQKFISLVAQSRHKSIEQIDRIAQGQVWLGIDAYQLGLVDELGDFDQAVQQAAILANLSASLPEVVWYNSDISLLEMLTNQHFLSGRLAWQSIANHYLPTSLASAFAEIAGQQSALKAMNDPKYQYVYCLECRYHN